MTPITLQINGMRGEGCTKAIWSAITRQRGVHVCNVSIESGQAHVVFDENQTSEESLRAAVERAGYEVTVKT